MAQTPSQTPSSSEEVGPELGLLKRFFNSVVLTLIMLGNALSEAGVDLYVMFRFFAQMGMTAFDTILYSFLLAFSIAITVGSTVANFIKRLWTFKKKDAEELPTPSPVKIGIFKTILAELLRFTSIFAKALAYALAIYWTFHLFLPLAVVFPIALFAFVSTLICVFALANEDVLEFFLVTGKIPGRKTENGEHLTQASYSDVGTLAHAAMGAGKGLIVGAAVFFIGSAFLGGPLLWLTILLAVGLGGFTALATHIKSGIQSFLKRHYVFTAVMTAGHAFAQAGLGFWVLYHIGAQLFFLSPAIVLPVAIVAAFCIAISIGLAYADRIRDKVFGEKRVHDLDSKRDSVFSTIIAGLLKWGAALTKTVIAAYSVATVLSLCLPLPLAIGIGIFAGICVFFAVYAFMGDSNKYWGTHLGTEAGELFSAPLDVNSVRALELRRLREERGADPRAVASDEWPVDDAAETPALVG